MTNASVPPIVIDLGARKKKHIRQLKNGRGAAQDEVARVLESVRTDLAAEAEGKILVPVVIVYRRKRKRAGWARGFGLY
ncbi:hypothetical protein [Ahniella affigens]|nr:hypothetical protein [Ahniella affigens]